MDHAPSAERPQAESPKWTWLKARSALVISMASAFVAAIGFDVAPRELIRPILNSAGYVEISASHQDTETLVKRIQDIAHETPDHALIKRLRELSKEAASPFDGRDMEIRLRLSEQAARGAVGVVCRNSDLRDTYLQFLSRNQNLVILKVADGVCTQGEVQVNQETWALLGLDQGRPFETLKMHVLLHRPPELI